jgi:hypothetical protein
MQMGRTSVEIKLVRRELTYTRTENNTYLRLGLYWLGRNVVPPSSAPGHDIPHRVHLAGT